MSGEGYVYVPHDDRGVMAAAREGMRISNRDRRPPYIVVAVAIETIIVARWPGRLWRVRISDRVTDADERGTGVGRPVPSAGYARAVAVDVLEEIPSHRLFGEHGEAVCEVITRASQLDLGQVRSLAESRHSDAGKAYSRVWQRLLAGDDETRLDHGEDLTGTLTAPSHGRSGSPIHCGFAVVHRTVWDRADAIVGASAFIVDSEGEKSLEPTWSAAAIALIEAAMAFGAPDLSEAADRRVMAAAWHSVFGDEPHPLGG